MNIASLKGIDQLLTMVLSLLKSERDDSHGQLCPFSVSLNLLLLQKGTISRYITALIVILGQKSRRTRVHLMNLSFLTAHNLSETILSATSCRMLWNFTCLFTHFFMRNFLMNPKGILAITVIRCLSSTVSGSIYVFNVIYDRQATTLREFYYLKFILRSESSGSK